MQTVDQCVRRTGAEWSTCELTGRGWVKVKAMKTADERIDHLERKVAQYRILVVLMVVLIVVVMRKPITSWIDSVESWVSGLGSNQANAAQTTFEHANEHARSELQHLI